MRIRRPSPSMVVSVIALVMASAGTSIAAVSFATNSGAVDGLSAVRAGSPERAAGKLVATARTGPRAGTFPNYHVSGVPHSDSFGQLLSVPDNQTGGAVDLDTTELGKLTVACSDENNTAGNENPTSQLAFTTTSANGVNFARHVGYGGASIGLLQPNAAHGITVPGQNTFRLHLELAGVNVVYEGYVRQLNQGTADAQCLVVGTRELIKPEK
jgi:hypothetical protein